MQSAPFVPSTEQKAIAERVSASFADASNMRSQELIQLLIQPSQYNNDRITSYWDTFRMTNGECLRKHPNVSHIKARTPLVTLTGADKALYDLIETYFLAFIKLECAKKAISFHSNMSDEAVVFYYDDRMHEFTIFRFAWERQSFNDSLIIEGHYGVFVAVRIIEVC